MHRLRDSCGGMRDGMTVRPLAVGPSCPWGAFAKRRSDPAGSPPRRQWPSKEPFSRRGAGAQRRLATFVDLSSSRLRVFACDSFPPWLCLTRSREGREELPGQDISVPATVHQKETAWLPVLRSFLRASASPREPVAALNRMATTKQSSAMATRTSPPRSLEGDA